jgi:hypothetical protein
MKFFGRVSTTVLFFGIVSGVTLGGCETAKDLPREEVARAVHARIGAKVDPTMPSAERNLLTSVVVDMMSADFVAEPGNAFARAFGVEGVDGVARYLDERIRYVLPSGVSGVRFRAGEILPPGESPDPFEVAAIDVGLEDNSGNDASNLSVALLPLAYAYRNQEKMTVYLAFGGELVPMNAARMGVVRLGPLFADTSLRFVGEDGQVYLRTWVSRSTTLVHEARHSDCTGGIAREDLDQLKRTGRFANESCGYLHAPCPEFIRTEDGRVYPHPYARLKRGVCDREVWGPHGMELAYLSGLRACRTCGEHEKQEILVKISEAIHRSPSPGHALTPNSGTPDLSSKGLD